MYISTRGGVAPVTASKAIYQGLAPDGGLFVPETVPSVSQDSVSYPHLDVYKRQGGSCFETAGGR